MSKRSTGLGLVGVLVLFIAVSVFKDSMSLNFYNDICLLGVFLLYGFGIQASILLLRK